MKHDRRRFLRLSGLAAAGVLAGCSGGGNGDDGGTTAGDGNGGGTTSGGAATETATSGGTAGGGTTGGGVATQSPTEAPVTTGGGAPSTGTGTGTGGTGTATTVTNTGDGSGGSQALSRWLSDVGNYDGTIEDETGQGAESIDVGAEGNGGNFAFDPPAMRISTGTTVTWEWTGEGGAHNVVAEDGSFRSGPPQQGSDIEYQRTFDSPGTVLYYCEPHRSLGMKGAIIVEG